MDTENCRVDDYLVNEVTIKAEDADGYFMTLAWAVDLLGRSDDLSDSDHYYLMRLTDLLDEFNR